MEYLDWYKLFVRMIAISILVHDALYICRDGKSYLTSCILPTFGLRLNGGSKLGVHLGLLISCLGIIWQPTAVFIYPICLIFLSLKIASYSLRLANHMIFAWFLILLLCIAAAMSTNNIISDNEVIFVMLAAQGLVLILYFFAFFHKLNREYFSMNKSCATAFVDFFCMDREITKPKLLKFYRYFGVYGTVLIEVIIPLFLLFEQTRLWGVLLGIAFHFILALMGIVNFSIFMYTGLFAFITPAEYHAALQPPATTQTIWLVTACLIFLLIVWRWTPRRAAKNCDYVYRKPAWIIQSAFGVLSGFFLFLCVTAMQLFPPSQLPSWSTMSLIDQLTLGLLLCLFFINGIGPYLGYKTEFSFAMFSNLRLEPWSHLLIPVNWRVCKQEQYVEVKKIEGLPTAEEVSGNKAAELALFVLSRPTEYYYSRYFFREALRILKSSVLPSPQLSISYVEKGSYREISGSDDTKPGFCLPINCFPFVMPRDLNARHSEQGSLVPDAEKRQIF